MTADDLIKIMAERDMTFVRDGDRLRIRGDVAKLTPKLKQALELLKPKIYERMGLIFDAHLDECPFCGQRVVE